MDFVQSTNNLISLPSSVPKSSILFASIGMYSRRTCSPSLLCGIFSMKLELLTNANVVDDAIRFVSQKSKESVKSSSSDEYNRVK
jgi:hypothetical protein